MSVQLSAVHHEEMGWPSEKWTIAAMTPAPAGIGIPTKYFLPGRPGFEGCGFTVILKRANRLAPAIKNRKLATAPSCVSLIFHSVRETGGIKWNPQVQANIA